MRNDLHIPDAAYVAAMSIQSDSEEQAAVREWIAGRVLIHAELRQIALAAARDAAQAHRCGGA